MVLDLVIDLEFEVEVCMVAAVSLLEAGVIFLNGSIRCVEEFEKEEVADDGVEIMPGEVLLFLADLLLIRGSDESIVVLLT